MATVRQDRAAMAEAVTRTGEAFDAINGIRGQVQQRTSELLATWQGDAAVRYDRVVAAWDERARRALNALGDLRERLGAARLKYENTEEEQTRHLNLVDQALNGLV